MVLAGDRDRTGGSADLGAPPAPPVDVAARLHRCAAVRHHQGAAVRLRRGVGARLREGVAVRVRRGVGVRLHRDEAGSQTLELVLLLPVLAMVVMAVLQAGLAASELVIAQAAARDAARVAAVDDDTAARAAAEAVAGRRAVTMDVTPGAGARRSGDLVTVDLRLRSAVLHRVGVEAWFPASATMQVEGP